MDELLPIMYDKSYPFIQYSQYYITQPKLVAYALKQDITSQESMDNYPSTIRNTEISKHIHRWTDTCNQMQ